MSTGIFDDCFFSLLENKQTSKQQFLFQFNVSLFSHRVFLCLEDEIIKCNDLVYSSLIYIEKNQRDEDGEMNRFHYKFV